MFETTNWSDVDENENWHEINDGGNVYYISDITGNIRDTLPDSEQLPPAPQSLLEIATLVSSGIRI